MNKKGQVVIYGMMLFIIAFITMVILTSPIKDFTTTARDSSHLDCANTSISTGTKLTCITVDLTMFYFVGAVITAAGGYMFMRGQGG